MKIFFENRMLDLVDFRIDGLFFPLQSQDVDYKREDELIERFLCSPDGTDFEVVDYNTAAMHSALLNKFRKVDAAGGIVLIDGKMLAIVRNDIPDLPKGHVEAGEDVETAAIREVTEETGQERLGIVRRLSDSWHCYLFNGQWTLKRTAWFLMTTDAPVGNRPQEEEGITRVELVGKESVRDFLSGTFRSIRENLGEEIVAILSK